MSIHNEIGTGWPTEGHTNYSGTTKYGYQRNPRNVGMTLLFAVLTKNDSFRSYNTFVYLLRARMLNIKTCTTQLALMDMN